jgi:RHS repeat-associated protein
MPLLESIESRESATLLSVSGIGLAATEIALLNRLESATASEKRPAFLSGDELDSLNSTSLLAGSAGLSVPPQDGGGGSTPAPIGGDTTAPAAPGSDGSELLSLVANPLPDLASGTSAKGGSSFGNSAPAAGDNHSGSGGGAGGASTIGVAGGSSGDAAAPAAAKGTSAADLFTFTNATPISVAPAASQGGSTGVLHAAGTDSSAAQGQVSTIPLLQALGTPSVTNSKLINPLLGVPQREEAFAAAQQRLGQGKRLTVVGTTFEAERGLSITGPVASFTDYGGLKPLNQYTATIDWGDGQMTAGVIGGPNMIGKIDRNSTNVSGTHTYTQLGTFTIQVTVKESQGPKDKTTSTAVVVEPMMPLINGKPNCPPDWPVTDCSTGDCSSCSPSLVDGSGVGGSGSFSVLPISNVQYSGAPVRYTDGVIQLATTDLESSGFGAAWGLSRSWTNDATYLDHVVAGSGWVSHQLPHLHGLGLLPGSIALVTSGSNAAYFNSSDQGQTFTAELFPPQTITYNAAAQEYVLTDTAGDILRFVDFSSGVPASQQGWFKSLTDPAGNTTAVISWTAAGAPAELQHSTTSGGVTTTESLLYTYIASGANAGQLANATLRRQVNGGAWGVVRQVDYTYYDAGDPNGNAVDLKTANIKDAGGNVLETKYYRYYTSGNLIDGLKYVFNSASYGRLAAAFADPTTASDAQVATYADLYLEYNAGGAVSNEVVQGDGCSSCSGGQGTYTYTYSQRQVTTIYSQRFNSWKTKTIETLPDGNLNIVYTNWAGEVMLRVYHDAGSGQEWATYYRYDADQARVILAATPSAVSGYNESYADLLHNVGGNFQYLRDGDGLITTTTYGSSTTATTTTPGDAAGYVKEVDVNHGELGTAIPQSSTQYLVHQDSNGATVYPVANTTVYRNTDSTGAETTSTSYTWFSGTNKQQSKTVSKPVVSSAQNGPGTADTQTAVYDTYGRPIWTKDGDGFINYTAYDVATGAAVKTITDVDTTRTSDFQNLPSGWSTPSGGGLHLITQVEVDSQGRTTKLTDPNGNVSYTVYNDTNYEVRSYGGWNSSTHMPTGPTEVTRDDRSHSPSYTETLTLSAIPAVDGNGRPTGTEAISGLQSLSRSYISAGGQVTREDDYFNLTGLTYSTALYIGTQNTNYYSTLTDYNPRGLVKRTQLPTGTINWTVYDGLKRVVSSWVGTNDNGATNSDPTGGGATGNNMVKVSDNVYDGGGVGDGNLTQTTSYPGGSAVARVSQSYYDWRDRQVASKNGVQASEDNTTQRMINYSDLDNLGQATAVSQYDGDGVTITFTSGMPNKPSSSLLRGYSTTAYDDQGRGYLTKAYSVDPSSGSVSTYALTTNKYFDHRGSQIAISGSGGQWTKQKFDGAGRLVVTYLTDGATGTSWSNAGSVSNDAVLEQREMVYDADRNVIESINRERFDSETATGPLGNASTTPKARVSYSASYYDASSRAIASVDVGTNGGSSWTRPASPPSRSDSVLITTYGYAADAVQQVSLTGAPTGGTFTLTYGGQTTSAIAYNASATAVQSALQGLATIGSGNALVAGPAGGPWAIRFTGSLGGVVVATPTGSGAGLTGGMSPSVSIAITSQGGDGGRIQQTTDPRGIVSKTDYDLLDRTVRAILAYSSFVPGDNSDLTTEYTYDGGGHQLTITADMANAAFETTQYVYGVSASAGSDFNSNDILAAMKYPDPSTGNPSSSQQETYTVNALGEMKTKSDRDGNVHTYTYDVLGRPSANAVSTLGTGVDGGVRRIETAYNSQGSPYLFTSYDAPSGGNIVNQVQDAYNGLRQLMTEYQAHSGAVNTSTTPKVQYAYTEMSAGANNSRMTTMTYPNGRVIHFAYNSGLDDSISRLSYIADDNGSGGVGTHLEEYSYLGLGTVVKRAHPQPGVDLTYIKQTGESNGDAGDQYTGLDRFGRVVDLRWIVASSGSATDRFKYGYDRNGNRLYRDNLINSAFGELYHANGASNGYDNVNQLTTFARGTLSDTNSDGIPDTIASSSHNQNWSLDALGNWSSVSTDGSSQTRTANKQNEITSITGLTTPAYDANGNMTTDQTGHTLVYDAWNRLLKVKNGPSVLQSYSYDAENRRIVENPGTAVDLFFSKDWQVIEERVGATTKVQYVWSAAYADAMIERDRDADGNPASGLEERLYVQQDANWNVTAVINTSGSVQERYIEDPYGSASVLASNWSSQSGSNFGWIYLHQGGRYDSTSGLYSFRNRDYSPVLGRWAELDPQGFAAGDTDLYRYEASRPTEALDPRGLADYTLTYKTVGIAQGATYGAFVWPIKWSIMPAAGKKGGSVVQYISVSWAIKDRDGQGTTRIPKLLASKDSRWFESWQLQPGETEPKGHEFVPPNDVIGAYKQVAGIDIPKEKAHDWYLNLPAPSNTGGFNPDWILVLGMAAYFDCLDATDLRKNHWTNTARWTAAGSLLNYRAGPSGNAESVEKMLKNYPARSPWVLHNMLVTWRGNSATTIVTDQDQLLSIVIGMFL